MHVQHEHHQRIAVNRQQRVICAQNGLMQPRIANVSPVHDRRHSAAIRPRQIGATNKPGYPVVEVLRFNRNHSFGGVHAVNRRDHLQQVAASRALQQRIAVMPQRKGDFGVRQCLPIHHIGDMSQFRLDRLHILQPCRGIVK